MDNEDQSHDHQLTNGDCSPNGISRSKYVSPEMCVYCFDVLISHLNRTNSPKTPHFSNDEL